MSDKMSVSAARDGFAEVVNRVAYGHERIVIERHGRQVAAVVSAEDAALLAMLEDQLDIAAVRAALADPTNAHPLDWNAVRGRLGRRSAAR
jgi:prevent-host-death family protein